MQGVTAKPITVAATNWAWGVGELIPQEPSLQSSSAKREKAASVLLTSPWHKNGLCPGRIQGERSEDAEARTGGSKTGYTSNHDPDGRQTGSRVLRA